jgi:hypothetical protein
MCNHFHIVLQPRRHPRPTPRTGRITRPVVASWSGRRPPPLYSARVNAGTRKARNEETPRRAHDALTPASAFGNLPTAARRIPASGKRLRISVLGWVSLELGPTPIARNRAHSHRRAPALVSGRPCAGHPIGLILAPAPTLLRPSWRRVYDRPPPLTGPKLTLMIAPFGTKRANFGHSDKKVGVCNCLSPDAYLRQTPGWHRCFPAPRTARGLSNSRAFGAKHHRVLPRTNTHQGLSDAPLQIRP